MLSEKSLDDRLNAWYKTSVSCAVVDDNNGREYAVIAFEKSTKLITAIAKAIGKELTSKFSTNLRAAIDSNPELTVGFKCKWKDIPEQTPTDWKHI